MHWRWINLAVGALTLALGLSHAQSTPKVKLGNTTIIGTSQNVSDIGVDFFGGNGFTFQMQLILNYLS